MAILIRQPKLILDGSGILGTISVIEVYLITIYYILPSILEAYNQLDASSRLDNWAKR